MTPTVVQYGRSQASVIPAGGARGVLCKRAGGHGYFFRVYDESGAYIDYDLRHDDLEITIDPDTMAALYDLGDICVLDHSPEVLGLSSVESQFASE